MSTQEQALQRLRKVEGYVGLVLSLDFVRSIFQLPAFSFNTSPFFPGFHSVNSPFKAPILLGEAELVASSTLCWRCLYLP